MLSEISQVQKDKYCMNHKRPSHWKYSMHHKRPSHSRMQWHFTNVNIFSSTTFHLILKILFLLYLKNHIHFLFYSIMSGLGLSRMNLLFQFCRKLVTLRRYLSCGIQKPLAFSHIWEARYGIRGMDFLEDNLSS